MITSKDFEKLTDDLQSIFDEVSASKIADMKGKELFGVFDTGRLTYDHEILHGVSGIEEVGEGKDLPRVSSEEGDNITWTQRYFGAIVPITKKMRKFDLYNKIESRAKAITEDAWDKFDQSLADVLLYGWSTSYNDVYGKSVSGAGPDGLALFSASHTTPLSSDTFSNIIQDSSGTSNPTLTRDAIVRARADAKVYTDPNGLVRPINLDTLVVAPSNEDLADRLVMSEYIPGSANNDKNPLKGKIKKVIVWERLETRSDGTDTSAYWFLLDSKKAKGETLNALFAERPTLDAPDEVYSNKNWDYSIDYFYTTGIGFPAYVRGSNGSES